MGRPAEDLAAEGLAALEHAVEMRHGRGPDLRVRRDRVGLGPHHGDGRRAQAQALESLAQALERSEVGRVEDRHLDGVKADRFQLIEDRVVLGR